MIICVFCQQVCDPAPTTRGWSAVGNQQGLHFDCAAKVLVDATKTNKQNIPLPPILSCTTYEGKVLASKDSYYQIFLKDSGPVIGVEKVGSNAGFGFDWTHLRHLTKESAEELIAKSVELNTFFVEHAIRFCARGENGETVINEETIKRIMEVVYRWDKLCKNHNGKSWLGSEAKPVVADKARLNRTDIEKAGFEYVYKNISTHRVNANYFDDDDLRAFVDGFEFCQWCNEVSMTGPEVPLHIKYKMFYDQQQAKRHHTHEKGN